MGMLIVTGPNKYRMNNGLLQNVPSSIFSMRSLMQAKGELDLDHAWHRASKLHDFPLQFHRIPAWPIINSTDILGVRGKGPSLPWIRPQTFKWRACGWAGSMRDELASSDPASAGEH